MELTQIQYQLKEQTAYITLNRPDKLNALTEEMLAQWRFVLTEIAQNETCRIVIVDGAGKSWSAGVDLALFQKVKIEPGFQAYDDGVEIMRLLETMPQVTIAKLNGYCFTGALEILMAFDLIIAADEAKLGDTHTKWGIPPKWGMTQRLSAQIGLRKAKELSFTARTFSGKEAAEMGLVNKAVPREELDNSVEQLAAEILKNSAQTIAAVKDLYHFGSKHSLQEGLDYERDYETNFTDKKDSLKNFKKEI